jgi:hypothetical protein
LLIVTSRSTEYSFLTNSAMINSKAIIAAIEIAVFFKNFILLAGKYLSSKAITFWPEHLSVRSF